MADERRARSLILPVAASLLAGCAPLVAHGPRVEPGMSVGITAAIAQGEIYENGDDPGPFLGGALMTNLAYGWRPAEGRLPAVRVGVHTSPMRELGTDVYVQAPPRWLGSAALGVGLRSDGGKRHMPYAQLGRTNRDGLGAHVTVGRFTSRWSGPIFELDERAALSTLSVEIPTSANLTTHVHAAYATGHVVKRQTWDGATYLDEDRSSGIVGLTLELHRKRR
jgi:hypothetical protein